MPVYKLTYFNFRALGEPIRILLAYGRQEYEDIRMEYLGEEWLKLKPSLPFGQAPILEIDGKRAVQHKAIARYLAKQYELVGDNDWEALQADIIVDTIRDFTTKIFELIGDEKKHEEALKTTIPFYLEKLNALAASGYLANEKLTWADLYFLAFVELFDKALKGSAVDKYPNLKTVRDNVLAIPQVKEWIDKRPKTEF